MAFLLRILLAMLLVLACTFQAAGQGSDPLRVSIDRWKATAERAEEALQSGAASNDAFEILRAELATQRSEAENAADSGSVLVRSLHARLAVMGPAPGKDESEAGHIAAIRKQLSDQLADAEAPVLAARQAFARVDVLIDAIDALVRSRQTSDLLAVTPSPILPSSWKATIDEAGRYVDAIASDARRTVDLRGGWRIYFNDSLLPATVAAVLALLPFGLGASVLAWLERRIPRTASRRVVLQVAGLHLLRLLLSLIGTALLVGAIAVADPAPATTAAFHAGIIVGIIVLVLANWVGRILFTPGRSDIRLLDLSDELARRSYWLTMAFGATLALEALIDSAQEDFIFSVAAKSVPAAFVVALGSAVMFGFARILLAAGKAEEEEEGASVGIGFLRLLARAIQVAATLALVSSLAGYVPLARQVISPTILSLGIIGLGFIVHHAAIAGLRLFAAEDRIASSLLPILLGSVIAIASIPILFLVWGARPTDISEVWWLLSNGFDFGGTRVSLRAFITLVLTFLLCLFVARWLQRLVTLAILPKTRLDVGGRNAISTGLGYIGVILSALIGISAAGLDLSNLAIIAGALSVGVGFGLQTIVSNFVSGLILLIERPIKEGDLIEVSGFTGIVRKISVRSTRIETIDRHDVIIPNAELITGSVTNMTFSTHSARLVLPVSVAGRSDLVAVKRVLLEVASYDTDLLRLPKPQVMILKIGKGAIDLELHGYLADIATVAATRSNLYFAIHTAFGRNGVELA